MTAREVILCQWVVGLNPCIGCRNFKSCGFCRRQLLLAYGGEWVGGDLATGGFTISESRDSVVRKLDRLAYLMDSSIRLPGGFRIGLDGIIGLIPGFGDLIGLVISSYLIVKAAALGTSRSIILRMVGNVLLETLVGSIPILGDVFDFAFRANRRNMRLLQRHREDPGMTETRSGLWLAAIILALLLLLALVLVLFWRILTTLFQWIS